MPHILTLLVLTVLSQRAGPQQRQVKIHFIWHIYTRLRNFPPLTGVNIAGTVVPLSDKIVTLGVTLACNLIPCLTTSQTSVDLHIITSGHCVISGGFSQMTWPRCLPLPLSTHILITLTLSSTALQISRNCNVYKTQLLE